MQLGHALLEAGFAFPRPAAPVHLVVLEVPDGAALRAASRGLACADVAHACFDEPDDALGLTALATRAVTTRRERAVFRRFALHTGFSPDAVRTAASPGGEATCRPSTGAGDGT